MTNFSGLGLSIGPLSPIVGVENEAPVPDMRNPWAVPDQTEKLNNFLKVLALLGVAALAAFVLRERVRQ